jgi:hypothetical protein
MSRGNAIALGVFTAWPPLWAIILCCADIAMKMSGVSNPGQEPSFFAIVIGLHCLTTLETLILFAIYNRHLFKSGRVPQDKRALWAVVLLLGNIVAMPFYWYFYIWGQHRSGRCRH